MMTTTSAIIASAALIGHALAEDKALATLPVAFQFVATMLTSIPASLYMRRVGRRWGFVTGAAIGAAGAAIATAAIAARLLLAVRARHRADRLDARLRPVLPLRRRRHGGARHAQPGDLAGSAGRRGGGFHRPQPGAVHQGPVRPADLRRHLRRDRADLPGDGPGGVVAHHPADERGGKERTATSAAGNPLPAQMRRRDPQPRYPATRS